MRNTDYWVVFSINTGQVKYHPDRPKSETDAYKIPA